MSAGCAGTGRRAAGAGSADPTAPRPRLHKSVTLNGMEDSPPGQAIAALYKAVAIPWRRWLGLTDKPVISPAS